MARIMASSAPMVAKTETLRGVLDELRIARPGNAARHSAMGVPLKIRLDVPGLPRRLGHALGHWAGRRGGPMDPRLFGDAEVDQLTNGHRRFERSEAFVDLGELQPPGDQVIELQPPLAP